MTTAMWIAGAIALVFWVVAGILWDEERHSIDFYGFVNDGKNLATWVAAISTAAFILLAVFR